MKYFNAYNANLVWLLYSEPTNTEQYEDEDEPTLILGYVKNKLSYFKGYRKLRFQRKTGKLYMESKDSSGTRYIKPGEAEY